MLSLIAIGLTVASIARPCREHPQLVDPCFTVRGRMRAYNGNPSVRIWRVGTTRMLGVSDQRFKMPDVVNLPADLEAMVTTGADLYADFVVCPFTRDVPGVMRMVCVESAGHVTSRPVAGRER